MNKSTALGVMLCPLLSPFIAEASPVSPNVIIILVDDLGYDELGFMGSDDILSPNLDKLAAGGTHFSQGYMTSSVCGPSRSGLISGRYQDRLGIWGNFGAHSQRGFPLNHEMLQDRFKHAGYTTGAIGKWHLGMHDDAFKPWNRNFDYFYGFLGGGHKYSMARTEYTGRPNEWPIQRNAEIVEYQQGDYLTEVFSQEAVDFIDRHHDEPFFLYLAYNAPHAPWEAPQSYFDRVDAHFDGQFETRFRRILSAMMLAVDDGVGAVMSALERHDITDNTAVIFLSDNGYQTRMRRVNTTNHAGNPADLRGFKGDSYEGGIRVPYILHWPNEVPAGLKYEKPVMSLDIAPTITRHLTDDGPQHPYDGVDLIPFLKGENTARPHEWMFFRYVHDIAYRKGDWVITWNDQHKIAGERRNNRELPMEEQQLMLFNLADDVSQQQDLRASHPEKFAELYRDYLALLDTFPDEDYPALFDTPYTVINADSL
ncbi:sulfatase-like hydrolase/transferase [Thaumasiovibrio subtropicus]|uniref:sulfatase-like hydrolase/transferase n=1 Tax=Thaumasiovibrio subtropicus TaxID=1891207 RepID=UPI000B358822|nr:sulfatase-like hydrolase/transferase [Thaumasiovibrio subtropicus]